MGGKILEDCSKGSIYDWYHSHFHIQKLFFFQLTAVVFILLVFRFLLLLHFPNGKVHLLKNSCFLNFVFINNFCSVFLSLSGIWWKHSSFGSSSSHACSFSHSLIFCCVRLCSWLIHLNLSLPAYGEPIIIIIFIIVFSHQLTLMVFHWSFSDSKSPRVSRTLLSI